MLYRNYIENQATLILNNNSNNSQNQVWEIINAKNSYSRYIFSIDLTSLRSKLTSATSGSTQHSINFFNAINFRNDLIGKKDVNGFTRSSNFSLQLFGFTQDFVNGIGYNYVYTTGNTVNQVPNWFQADNINNWGIPGIYSGNTANIIDTNYLTQGNENLVFNASNYINNLIYNTTATTANMGVAYTSDYEINTGNTSYNISFFSKYTSSFFEPFLQTTVDDLISDNRNEFKLDDVNELYLYLNTPISAVTSVVVYDYNSEVYLTLTGNSITQVNNLTYKISLSVPSSEYPDSVNFCDTWNIIDGNGISRSHEQEFTLVYNDIFDSTANNILDSQFYITTHGILNGDIISQSETTRRIIVFTKQLYNSTIYQSQPIDYLQYRLYVLQGNTQIEVIPFQAINKTNVNYFDLDICSLIPQTYYLEIRVNYNNIIIGDTKIIRFSLASEK